MLMELLFLVFDGIVLCFSPGYPAGFQGAFPHVISSCLIRGSYRPLTVDVVTAQMSRKFAFFLLSIFFPEKEE